MIRNLKARWQRQDQQEFVRAAHYFADGWALNMWQVAEPKKFALTCARSARMALTRSSYWCPGGIHWRPNDNYSDWPSACYSYWAPFMGAENVGETLTSDRALEFLRYMMGLITEQGGNNNHIIDQFNFVDDTAVYQDVHARIEPTQIPAFLEGAAPVLRKFSRGYGVWAYRDYRQNIFYNPKFLMGMAGWEVVRGKVTPVGRNSPGVKFGSGAILRQTLPAPVAGLQRAVPFTEFQLEVSGIDSGSKLMVRVNTGAWHAVEHTGSSGRVSIAVDYGQVWDDGLLIEIRNDGPRATLLGLVFYHTTFIANIRGIDGEEGPHLAALHGFNRKLGAATY